MEDLGTHILIALLPVTVFYAGFSLLFVGVFFLMGPLYAGMARVGLRKARTGQVDFRDFTDGFSRYFLPAFFNCLLVLLFSSIGFIFLIVPGVVILAMYQFSYHLIADHDQDFWSAMESSRKLVAQDYFGFTMFGVVLALINLLGVSLMGIGLLASLPITWLSLTAAYLDFSGGLTEPASAPPRPVRID